MKLDDGIDYYIPLTLNELVDGIKGIISRSDELTGQELITHIEVINDEDYNVPPGSIAVFLRQNTLDPDEPRYGTIILTPNKTQTLM